MFKNILIIGGGGREHAIAKKISESNHLNNLYCIPGNPGTKNIATNIDLDSFDFFKVKEFAIKNNIDLIIPGSEVYLAKGITDYFSDTSITVFGPTKDSAMIESSKEFAKEIMKTYNIPTAKYEVLTSYLDAVEYIKSVTFPLVIKFDGLAGGKGVVIAENLNECVTALKLMLEQRVYGKGNVLIEEFLEGIEFSLMAFVHNDKIIPMPTSQDHKRLLDNDLGPNTGGMGIYSPVPMISEEMYQRTIDEIMIPTIKALKSENKSFSGFLYGGIMYTKTGPKVIEFNARFGDPEAEILLPRLKSDLIELIYNLTNNIPYTPIWDNLHHLGIVMASDGYPGVYKKEVLIDLGKVNYSDIFHMGTKNSENKLLTNGGRVLFVRGKGKTLKDACITAYNNVKSIQCDNLIYRKDIGNKALEVK
ncbi:phosphoribosylamine--glycine ligase [Candidatus Izimaplasma bacterium ZiA1]|uniref:phosphoribosylamine--glycine ligase n=1 Tax=Candidatus Izimoplasma sp. ZiA1 TaxID=2024899 RepID=UPI000BAA8264|nr:phosphoribosylamine--glycine ligase [Candidatus Izimaplasma bacterium ZiA1]